MVPASLPPAALLRTCEHLQRAGRQNGLPGKLLLSLICPWHCSHRGTKTGVACFSCLLKIPSHLSGSVPGASGSPVPKMRTSADSRQAEGTNLESSCSASSAHGTARTEAKRLGLLACPAISKFKRRFGKLPWVTMPSSFRSPSPKMRTSADSWQSEGAILESCCSASSAHGTARTEAQRLRMLACLATSKFKRNLGGPCRTPLSALLRKCERLQIARRQKGLTWEALAQPHLPMALLAQRHRDRGFFVLLPPQTPNVDWEWGGSLPGSLLQPFSENANVCR